MSTTRADRERAKRSLERTVSSPYESDIEELAAEFAAVRRETAESCAQACEALFIETRGDVAGRDVAAACRKIGGGQ